MRRRRCARSPAARGQESRPRSRLSSPLSRLSLSDQVVLERERSRRRSRRKPQLPEDVLDVPRDGVLADLQNRGDLAVALARGDEPDDLELARRQCRRIRIYLTAAVSVELGNVLSDALGVAPD